MPQQLTSAVENNFTKGLVTEATGLNFPENAATLADNCEFTLVGDVKRRLGIDLEPNFGALPANRTNNAQATYIWKNVGGDGSTQLEVVQIGDVLRFYDISASTVANPLSDQLLASTVTVTDFVFGTFNADLECTFTDGNGYLFVYHENCTPFFCSYDAGTITANIIDMKIRDFTGAYEIGVPVNRRDTSLSAPHTYNLLNQGWTAGSPWIATTTGTTPVIATGSQAFTVPAGIAGVVLGTVVSIAIVNDIRGGQGLTTPAGTIVMSGTVTAYAATTMTINVTGAFASLLGQAAGPYVITPVNNGFLSTWNTAIGNWPSNADTWWYFKNASGVFDPATRVANVTLNTGPAPRGHFIIDPFNQDRALIGPVGGITPIVTFKRPRIGAWFQGRVWYSGVDDSQAATGNANFYSWTENIYFSKVVETPEDFGACYQTNDPTSETLFDLLPTDGGVIKIQGAGAINKLFPIQNGMLVHAANGIWFITGSQGIGFTANDYTITKISNISSLSSQSFVDVEGLPYFWNEDGIYAVKPQQGGGLAVQSVTFDTIDSMYNEIPLSSKELARGAYDPVRHVIQWIYKDEEAEDLVDSYEFNRMLNYNTLNKAFFTYSIDSSFTTINSIQYVQYSSGAGKPASTFTYLTSFPDGAVWNLQFSHEYDEDYLDWDTVPTGSFSYDSYFVTGYKLRGQAIKRFQPQYVQIYSRTNGEDSSYKVQGVWDYTNSGNSGRWSSVQVANISGTNRDVGFKRHKIRGHGYSLQFKVASIDGEPFDIIGWAVVDTVNQGT